MKTWSEHSLFQHTPAWASWQPDGGLGESMNSDFRFQFMGFLQVLEWRAPAEEPLFIYFWDIHVKL